MWGVTRPRPARRGAPRFRCGTGRPRARVALAGALVGVLATLAACGGNQAGAEPAASPPASPAGGPTDGPVSGTVVLADGPGVNDGAQGRPGQPCTGTGDFRDVGEGAPVALTTEDGETRAGRLGTGVLGRAGVTCRFGFTVEGSPAAGAVSGDVTVAGRPTIRMADRDGGLQLRLPAAHGAPAPDPETWGSEPVLDETFDEPGLPPRWTSRSGTVSNNEAVYRPENVSVADGALRIASTTSGSSYFTGDMQTYPYGWVTPGNYFRAEVRAKVPLEPGFWPAPLWFRPVVGGTRSLDGSLLGGAMADGEIDLMEGYGSEAPDFEVHGTLHGAYDETPHKQLGRTYPFAALRQPDPTAWHTYVIEKTPGRIDMWVDEVRYGSWTTEDIGEVWPPGTFQAVMENPDYRWGLRVTVQIGSPLAGYPGPDNDWSPEATDLLVDRITVWDHQG